PAVLREATPMPFVAFLELWTLSFELACQFLPAGPRLIRAVQAAVFANLRPDERGGDDDDDRANTAGDDRKDRTEKMGHEAGLKSPQFIRCADEQAVHSRDTAAHLVGREQLHQGVPHDHADVVHRSADEEHYERQPERPGEAEDDRGQTERSDGPDQGMTGPLQ